MVAVAAAALTLVLTDVQGLPLDRPTLERSVAAALADTGLAPRWDEVAPGAERPWSDGEVRVILLDSRPARGSELVLGSVLREPARTPALWVYVGGVKRVLDGAEPGASNRLQLSIAVGRIVAHEVAHLVAPQQPHAGEGLMGRKVDRRVLLQADAALDADCRAAIRSALSMGLGPALATGVRSTVTIGTSGAEFGPTGLMR